MGSEHPNVYLSCQVGSWFMSGGFRYLCYHGAFPDIAHHNDWLDGLCIRIRQELGTDMRETRRKGIFVFGFVYFLHSLPLFTCCRYVARETCVYSPLKTLVLLQSKSSIGNSSAK
ncbi:hypothetical protein TRIATDRAFT_298029 [Trichoderma atroviride IMI 206040]|uniref:Uncharacterized protein n=1 Tax=Hypocrea atroviridis (strain ATCC 20476 / IMI 206040) TaxID=452589 RepID=G9NL16_HYPAI|nr:uncharacterized protein TRIATDRAFT_298029 [Trichoderma atroviride IMI 206040]EHK48584.1 hypothetical protein TRIATDRAFT_298029 [Trichoderma atroviride IMI 206040]